MNGNKRVKVGVIGCGYWGPNLIRNFSQIEDVEVSYLCDINELRLEEMKKKYPGAITTKDYKEILDNKEVDAVVVALPVFKHYEIVKEALLKNKNVLVEKPFTSTSKEAEELIKIAKEKGKVLMVDHTFEYSPAINKMKEIIESGELGEIYYIRAEWLNLGLFQPDVNVSWDLATHIISIINYLLGLEAKSVSDESRGFLRKNIQEIASINLEFPNNVSAYIVVGWLEPEKTRKMIVVGSKKMLVYDMMDSEKQVKVFDKSALVFGNRERFKVEYTDRGFFAPEIEKTEPLGVMARHFVECVKDGTRPRSDGESGLRVVKVLEAIDKLKDIKGGRAEL